MSLFRINSNIFDNVKKAQEVIDVFIKSADFYVICNGRRISDACHVKQDCLYEVVPRLIGGKGGFGSMLRAIGAQIEKTTNHEACRDLSGRRMRDVSNEKNLREWVAKKAAREKEREEKKQERLEKRRTIPKHNFDDPDYHSVKAQVVENLEDAVYAGLQKEKASASVDDANNKRKLSADNGNDKKKKSKEWFGIDIDADDLSDSDDSTVEAEEKISGEFRTKVSHVADNNVSNGVSKNSAEFTLKTSVEDTLNPDFLGQKDSNNIVDSNLSQKSDLHSSNEIETDSSLEKNLKKEPQIIDVNSINSLPELLKYDLESLKITLSSMGLKCGGTLEQRAERLWSVKGLDKSEINDALFAKSTKQKNKAKS